MIDNQQSATVSSVAGRILADLFAALQAGGQTVQVRVDDGTTRIDLAVGPSGPGPATDRESTVVGPMRVTIDRPADGDAARLFAELEQRVVRILATAERPLSGKCLAKACGVPYDTKAKYAFLSLEGRGVIVRLPGEGYRLAAAVRVEALAAPSNAAT